MGEGLANLCAENLGNIGGLVGTAFVARDMMRVVDALDEDSLLRYWGKQQTKHLTIDFLS